MKKLGIVIGRFQIDRLHDGHVSLIEEATFRSDELLILLGCSSAKGTKSNPLDFETRKMMMNGYTKHIAPLHDRKSDEVWSQQIDTIVESHFDTNEYEVTIYGSRDSCLSHYSGKFNTELLIQGVEKHGFNATQVRHEIGKKPIGDYNFRQGAIYTAMNQYPKVHPTVDIAIFNSDYSEILLGRKHLETQFRFIGGFVDPTDANLEAAAKREVKEECGDIETDNYQYVASRLINDWRYRSEVDKIMTTLFTCQYVYGHCQGGDDIAEVKWVKFADLQESDLVTEHGKLLDILQQQIEV